MDTKWRKFSRSRFIKVFLVIIYIACAGAMGAVFGYVPAYGYIGEADESSDGFDSLEALFQSDYTKTIAFARELYSISDRIESAVKNADGNNTADALKVFPYYCRYQSDRHTLMNEVNPTYIFTIADGRIVSSEGTVNLNDGHNDNGVIITIGFTKEQFQPRVNRWNEIQRNLRITVISVLSLFILSVIILAMICKVFAEKPDGSVVLHPFYRTFYEITLAAIAGAGYLYLRLIMLDFHPDNGLDEFGVYMVMAVFGAATAFFMLLWLYLAVCMAGRTKSKCFLKGSVIAVILIFLFNIIQKICKSFISFGKFIKEIFTGELYAAKTAAKRFLWIDIAFIIVSAAALIVALLALEMYNIGMLLTAAVIEAAVLGLFLYGRYLMLKDGAQLEAQIKAMYYGNYDYKPELSKNSPYAGSSEKLGKIAGQYKSGMEESIRAERMKIELVTNVSHDLKTPLTSIISYVELLSKEELTPAASEYVNILKSKSERLKNIVSDVFDLAKTTSGEISIERSMIDLNKLSLQTLAEMEDTIAQSDLTVKTSICKPPVTVYSDGKRLYRVIQNLMDNALKYSMKGTRIYYTLEKTEDTAVITVKNISSYEMDFTKEEVLERFSRGDKSRSTEGSGLGLSIAQGFTIACGGKFDIDIDGDMFKVMITFPLAVNKEPAAEPKPELKAAGEKEKSSGNKIKEEKEEKPQIKPENSANPKKIQLKKPQNANPKQLPLPEKKNEDSPEAAKPKENVPEKDKAADESGTEKNK